MLTEPGEAFRHGFALVVGPSPTTIGGAWERLSLPAAELIHHPTTTVTLEESEETSSWVLIIGEPVDVEREDNSVVSIARSLCRAIDDGGADAAVGRALYLGGRHLTLIGDEDGCRLVPDCISSVPAYWTEVGDEVVIASHPNIIAELHPDIPRDEHVLDLMRTAKEMETGGTLYIPAPRTTLSGVRPLLANHCLRISDHAQGRVAHERIYPREPRPRLATEDAFQEFKRLFIAHTRLLIRDRPIAISLTGGLDSRMTLYAARAFLNQGSFAWTWIKGPRSSRAMVDDLVKANRQAYELSVTHRIVDLQDEDREHWFNQAYDRTFNPWRQHPKVPLAAATQLPREVDHFLSMVAEVGTGFYAHRSEPEPTAARLASLYCRFPFGELPEVRAIHDEFISYGDFRTSHFFDYDYHDLFYWESRIGRWGVHRMQELDLAHRVQLPFNHRGIVEALQAFSLEERLEKLPFRRLMAELTEQHAANPRPRAMGRGSGDERTEAGMPKRRTPPEAPAPEDSGPEPGRAPSDRSSRRHVLSVAIAAAIVIVSLASSARGQHLIALGLIGLLVLLIVSLLAHTHFRIGLNYRQLRNEHERLLTVFRDRS